MSYAEQHIFLSAQPLTPTQQEFADELSSHAQVGSNYAIYTYFYGGSFRGNEEELLSNGFDAMLWQDSTGCMHLRFRLPNQVVPQKELEPFIHPERYPQVEASSRSFSPPIAALSVHSAPACSPKMPQKRLPYHS
ncbi:MAG: hypothetical protein AAF840_00745 [Bacteroidota bacterium]